MASTRLCPTRNPYRVGRYPDVKLRLGRETVASLAQRFCELGFKAAILGPHGSGKTTLLENIYSELEKLEMTATLHYLPRFWGARICDLLYLCICGDRAAILLLDRGEGLSFVERMVSRLLTVRWRGVLITSHAQTLYPTLVVMHTSPELLYDVATELAESEGHTGPSFATCHSIFSHNKGNIRDALLCLYDEGSSFFRVL